MSGDTQDCKKKKDEFPRKGSSGSGSTPAYSVQARYMFGEPQEVNGVFYHKEWKTIRFDVAKVGVPSGFTAHEEAARLGLLDYAAAQALRWWFHASLGATGACSFETRILKHLVTHSYEDTILNAYDLIRDRGAVRPDHD